MKILYILLFWCCLHSNSLKFNHHIENSSVIGTLGNSVPTNLYDSYASNGFTFKIVYEKPIQDNANFRYNFGWQNIYFGENVVSYDSWNGYQIREGEKANLFDVGVKFILNEGLNFNPNNQNIIYSLGLAYYQIGFYDKCIQLLKQYYLYNNDDLKAIYTIGMAYFYNQDYSNAFKYLNQSNTNDDSEILYYLGACMYHLEEYQKAIPFYKKSLIINPNNSFAIYLLGQSYIVLGNKKESKRQLRLLMNIDTLLFETLKLSFDSKFEI